MNFSRLMMKLWRLANSGGAQGDEHGVGIFVRGEAAGEVVELVKGGERFARVIVEALTDRRGFDAVVAADEQAGAELAFELGDGPGDGLHRHEPTLRRSGKRPALQCEHEVSNLSYIHDHRVFRMCDGLSVWSYIVTI